MQESWSFISIFHSDFWGKMGIFSLTWKLAAAQADILRTACKQPAVQKQILQESDE